jgi:hypothetical protein
MARLIFNELYSAHTARMGSDANAKVYTTLDANHVEELNLPRGHIADG